MSSQRSSAPDAWIGRRLWLLLDASRVLHSDDLDADRYAVIGRLTGNFPGRVAELKWSFKLAGDRIEQLIIAP